MVRVRITVKPASVAAEPTEGPHGRYLVDRVSGFLGLRGEPGDRGIKLRPSKGAGVPGGQGGEVWGANGLDDTLPRLEPAASAQLLAEQHRDLVTDAEPSSFDVVERHGLSLCR